jgi:uncharacterized protein (DUF983 family)
MSNNQFRFPAIIIAVILGAIIFKHFNFKTLTLKEPWLDVVYIVTFVIILFLLFKRQSSK